MTDAHSQGETNLPRYTSFVLRCRTDDSGQVHARLIDARTRVEYPLSDLTNLPDLVRRLLTNTLGGEASQGFDRAE